MRAASTIPLAEASPVEQPPTRITRVTPWHTASVRAALPGLAVAVLADLFGFAMGGIFGLNEDVMVTRARV